MGLALTKEQRSRLRAEKKLSMAVDSTMVSSREEDTKVKKLLLLGAGESGKSTLFKQMVTLYGKGYDIDDCKLFKKTVHTNTLEAMLTLIRFSDELADEFATKVLPENEPHKDFVSRMTIDTRIDPRAAVHMEKLWQDPGIRKTYKLRARFQLMDSAEYFFGRLQDVCQSDYIPSQDDVLRTRIRTTGIVETEFVVDQRRYRMFDVGGQRNERKKWIHCFEGVTAVIFVAAISEFDQVLFEDDTTNRLHEALKLFDEICNSHWFQQTSIILFLNKSDIFEQKIKETPITVCFSDFPPSLDPNSYDEVTDFITQEFHARNLSPDQSSVYTHVTCATDRNNISHVFSAVKDIIITKSLKNGGLF